VITINGNVVRGMSHDEIRAIIGTAVGALTIVAAVPAHVVPAGTPANQDAPGGAKTGGTWGTLLYSGPETQRNACIGCLCCCLPGLCILACPSDKMDAYAVDGKVYDASGRYKAAQTSAFTPKQQAMQR